MNRSEAELQREIRTLVDESERRLTLADLQKLVSGNKSEGAKKLRKAVKELIDHQELMYVNEFGHTFLAPALNKPVRLSDRVVLKPVNCSFDTGPRDIVINFQHGNSFGGGQHPTTRLCLKGLEALLAVHPNLKRAANNSALDIGTGSGVLIIAAVQLGLEQGLGVDVDPISISEARKNVQINQLDDRIRISSQSFENIAESFDLIMANLRWPTLNSYLSKMIQNLKTEGILLVSGIRSQEQDALIELGEQNALKLVWQKEEKGWAAVSFSR